MTLTPSTSATIRSAPVLDLKHPRTKFSRGLDRATLRHPTPYNRRGLQLAQTTISRVVPAQCSSRYHQSSRFWLGVFLKARCFGWGVKTRSERRPLGLHDRVAVCVSGSVRLCHMTPYWLRWFLHGFACVNRMSGAFPMVCDHPIHDERGDW